MRLAAERESERERERETGGMSSRRSVSAGGPRHGASHLSEVLRAGLTIGDRGTRFKAVPDIGHVTCTFNEWFVPYSRLAAVVRGALHVCVVNGGPRLATDMAMDCDALKECHEAYMAALSFVDSAGNRVGTASAPRRLVATDVPDVRVDAPTQAQFEDCFLATATFGELCANDWMDDKFLALKIPHTVSSWKDGDLERAWPHVSASLTRVLLLDIAKLVDDLRGKVRPIVKLVEGAYRLWARSRATLDKFNARTACTTVVSDVARQYECALYDAESISHALEALMNATDTASDHVVQYLNSACARIVSMWRVDMDDVLKTFCTAASDRRDFEKAYSSVLLGCVGGPPTESDILAHDSVTGGLRKRTNPQRQRLGAGPVFQMCAKATGLGKATDHGLWSFYDLAKVVGQGRAEYPASSFEHCVETLLARTDRMQESAGDARSGCGTFNCTFTVKRDGAEYLLRVSKHAIETGQIQPLDDVRREMQVSFALGAHDVAPKLLCCVATTRKLEDGPLAFPQENWCRFMVFEKFDGDVNRACNDSTRHVQGDVRSESFLRGVATAVAKMSAVGIVNTDMKPPNMVYREKADGSGGVVVRLIDFDPDFCDFTPNAIHRNFALFVNVALTALTTLCHCHTAFFYVGVGVGSGMPVHPDAPFFASATDTIRKVGEMLVRASGLTRDDVVSIYLRLDGDEQSHLPLLRQEMDSPHSPLSLLATVVKQYVYRLDKDGHAPPCSSSSTPRDFVNDTLCHLLGFVDREDNCRGYDEFADQVGMKTREADVWGRTVAWSTFGPDEVDSTTPPIGTSPRDHVALVTARVCKRVALTLLVLFYGNDGNDGGGGGGGGGGDGGGGAAPPGKKRRWWSMVFGQ